MGLAIPFLIFWLVCGLHESPAASLPRCLVCHQTHYADRGQCTVCHAGNDKTGRKGVAHEGLVAGRYAWFALKDSATVKRGRTLLKTLGCRRCHTAGGTGERAAASLDEVPATRRVDEAAAAVRVPALYMPDFRLAEPDSTALVTAIYADAPPKKPSAKPVTVHFSRQAAAGNIFQKRCGHCHRMLSSQWGGLGNSDSGPNLSGLLGPYYPPTFCNAEPWTAEGMRKWLKNPRLVRPQTAMLPVPLTDSDFGELIKTFGR